MKLLQPRVSILLLSLALLIVPVYGSVLAQDDTSDTNNTITVTGSGIVARAFQAVVDASGAAVPLEVNVTGTGTGIDSFCSGTGDLVLANRALTELEGDQCAANGIQYLELLIGYDALAFITAAENTYLQCVTPTELNPLFAPSAIGQTLTWDAVNVAYPANPISVVLPAVDSLTYGRLDELVAGDGLRGDAQVVTDDAAVIDAVTANSDAIGLVNLSTVLALSANPAGIRAISYQNATLGTCISPSATTLADRTYTPANRLFVYVNAASLEKPGLSEVLNALVADTAAAALDTAGFIAPTSDLVAQAQATVNEGILGRSFSQEVTTFSVSPDVNATVNIGGAALFSGYITTLQESFAETYPGLVVNITQTGVPAGARRLCNGEIEILATYSDLTAEQQGNCAANNITPVSFEIGNQAAVLVANSSSAHLACLTTDQVFNAFVAKAPDTLPTNWTQVDPTLPDAPLLVFAPTQGDVLADLVLTNAAGQTVPLRDDAEQNSDPLYRAAAVANVPGSLTYMSWSEYQSVLANNQDRIQLVQINGGNGCVAPSPETIADSTYPLTRPVKLLVSQSSLLNQGVKSILWLIYSDQNYPLLESQGFSGLSFGELPALRDQLETSFTEAEAAVAAAAALTAPVETTGTEEASATEETAATDEPVATEDAAATEEPAATVEATPTAG